MKIPDGYYPLPIGTFKIKGDKVWDNFHKKWEDCFFSTYMTHTAKSEVVIRKQGRVVDFGNK